MDFQKLLDIAAQNKKKAEIEVIVNKRYTTSLPPPKKEKRSGVDLAAIKARLEKKQHDQKQKVLEEESKKKELLKLRAETKSKSKKSTERPQEHRRDVTPKENYKDGKHEVKHQSFMKKIQKVSERARDEDDVKVVSKRAPDLPKKPKKPAASSKGPMSYDQLLALAANQQKGKSAEGKSKKTTDSASKSKQIKSKPKVSEMDLKKAAAARKLGEMRRQEFLAQRRGSEESSPAEKSNGSSKNGATKSYKINGKKVMSELQRATPGFKKPDTVTSRPETSNAKTKHSSVPNGGMKHKSAGSSSKSVPNNHERRMEKQTPERKKPPMTLTQSTVDQYLDKAPSSGHRPRQVSDRRPEPKRQSKMEKYYDRVPSSSRPQPGLDRRAPSMGQQMQRKRPVSAAPSFQAKRGRLLSDEDSDYEEDGFIDDTPLEEEGGEDVSHYIKEIFGYDKSKYGYESDYALKSMETSYRDIQKEERMSTRIGMREDLEDIRREREENKRLAQKKKKKR
ncbi:uncharacterized protein [Asterias amurensis]|uniref:uncharacterized protein n=1 Tax=Asterias amurensis TaxID=7602 RepID=UPI003AB72B38